MIVINQFNQLSILKNILMGLLSLFMIIVLLSTKSAYATCSFMSNASKATIRITPADKTRSPTDTTTTITSYTFSSAQLSALYGVGSTFASIARCTEGETLIIGNASFPIRDNYLAANVEGVYFNVQGPSTSPWQFPYNGGNYTRTLPASGYITPAFLTNTGSATGNATGHVILSGQMLSGGTVNSGLILNMTTSDGLDILDIYVNSFSVYVPTCSVNNYDSSVELGDANSQQLKSVGMTSNIMPFSINMSCVSTDLKPTITFSGNTVDGYPSVLANNGDATGVGVQLLYGNNIITPNVVTSLGQATTTAAKDYNFNAQLYQTASTVTAGTVDVSTTFTINYE